MNQEERRLYYAFRALGLSESASLNAAGGRDHPNLTLKDVEWEPSPEEKALTEAFQRMGWSLSTSELAAHIRSEMFDLTEKAPKTEPYEWTPAEEERARILKRIKLMELREKQK